MLQKNIFYFSNAKRSRKVLLRFIYERETEETIKPIKINSLLYP